MCFMLVKKNLGDNSYVDLLAAALSFLTSPPPLASVSCDSVCKLSTWSNALRWNAAYRGSLDNSIFLWCLPWLALGRHR